MREEYDIRNLNPMENPYSNRVKKQVTKPINLVSKFLSNLEFLYSAWIRRFL